MTKHRDLAYGDRLPESFLDALAEFVSTALTNFQLTLASATSLQVVAGTGNAQVSVGINGRWRYNTATVNAAHPAGAAGQYDVFVTASDNSFALGPPEVDNTVYSFGLTVLAQGNVPGTALYRKVAETTWNGSAITAVTLTAGTLGSASPAAAPAMPAGSVAQYAGATAPQGWLFCNGTAVSRTAYSALFAAIGTAYGAGDGSTTFNLPDMRGRVAAGYDASQTEFNTLGKTGGAKTHTITVAEMPSHNHGGATAGGTTGAGTTGGGTTGTGTTGAGTTVASSTGTGTTGTGNTGTGTTGTGTTGLGQTTGGGSTGTGTTGNDSPDHTHSGATDFQGAHAHYNGAGDFFARADGTSSTGSGTVRQSVVGYTVTTDTQGSHAHNFSTAGASARHAHSVPSLTVPGLTIPALSVPGLSIPALTIPGLSVPALTIPALTVPGLSVPGLSIPGLSVPGLSVPGLGISSQGGGTAMDVTQPYITLNHIIKT